MAGNPPHQRTAEFERVALPHLNALFNLALKLTKNRKDAEDLVQEAYLRAFRFFDSYQSGTQIKAWLFRILRNTFINRYRAARARPDEVDFEKIQPIYDRMVDETFLHDHQAPTPEKIVMDGVMDHQIEEAMGELPEEYRAVVVLALVEEMSYKDIASTLSIPLGTVMSRLHRGRKLLQKKLLDYAVGRGIIKRPEVVDRSGD